MRPLHAAILFAVSLGIGGTATLWLTTTIVRLDRAQRANQEAAALEENVRLALWRMDSALGPFIAAESMRPYEQYNAFYDAPGAIDPASNRVFQQSFMLPSPLMTFESPYIHLHFQMDASGALSSPQVPDAARLEVAEENYLTQDGVERSLDLLAQLRPHLKFERLLFGLQRVRPLESAPALPTAPAESPLDSQLRSSVSEQFFRNQQAVSQNNIEPAKVALKGSGQRKASNSPAVESDASDAGIAAAAESATGWREEPMVPLWVGEELLLARTVRYGGKAMIQGCWLDWPEVQEWLLGLTRDLLPDARLYREDAAPHGGPAVPGRQLAALPVRLDPGPISPYKSVFVPTMHGYLLVAVGGIFLATLAAAALLWGAVSMSERRARFVSAVTHELRTPLTTFRLYTEMLAEGMVRDDATQREYAETLHAEANRLSHLVENVLAYARLERGRVEDRMTEMALNDLLSAIAPRLEQRALQAGMTLQHDFDHVNGMVRVDPGIVEQILFNLVDNACKYAVHAEDRRIYIGATLERGRACIRVRDYGPGIARNDRRRVFRPFTKSVHEAARTAPGVGLGLGLSRRLARSLGGELALETCEGPGACFVVRLPAVANSAHRH